MSWEPSAHGNYPANVTYQSLYRRYRPKRFSEVRGQDHVVAALRNAVRSNTVGHAYLFSGPRGTGKTSTARLLAKALNCENPQDGEPCGECESCVSMDAGRSYDLFELDAASNNGVEAMRDLISKAALGSPGRTKVYILDEVHMLTAAAANALLKTLEEPPDHVKFVLATTDPQKVLPTIKSRTQHFAFELLSAQELEDYVRFVGQDAGLSLDEPSIQHAVRQGKGSARDTLSALEQVVAAGGVSASSYRTEDIVSALATRDAGAALVAIEAAIRQGSDPRVLVEAMIGSVRNVFLAGIGAMSDQLLATDGDQVRSWASTMSPAASTRALELLGQASLDMRTAVDPRVPLEVAVVRASRPEADGSMDALAARIDSLEAAVRSGAVSARPTVAAAESVPASAEPATPAASASAVAPTQRPTSGGQRPPAARPAPPSGGDAALSGPAAARAQINAMRRQSGASESSGRKPPPVPTPPPAPSRTAPVQRQAPQVPRRPAVDEQPSHGDVGPASGAPHDETPGSPARPAASAAPSPRTEAPPIGGGAMPSTATLAAALEGEILGQLRGRAKALTAGGRILGYSGGRVVIAFSNQPTLDRALEIQGDLEAAFARHFSMPIPATFVTEDAAAAMQVAESPSPGASTGGPANGGPRGGSVGSTPSSRGGDGQQSGLGHSAPSASRDGHASQRPDTNGSSGQPTRSTPSSRPEPRASSHDGFAPAAPSSSSGRAQAAVHAPMYEEFVEATPVIDYGHAPEAAPDRDAEAETGNASAAGAIDPVAEPALADPAPADAPPEAATNSSTPRPGRHLRAVPDTAAAGPAMPDGQPDEQVDLGSDPFGEFEIDEDTFHRVDLHLLDDADPLGSPAERLIAAFPGAELMDDPNQSDRQEW